MKIKFYTISLLLSLMFLLCCKENVKNSSTDKLFNNYYQLYEKNKFESPDVFIKLITPVDSIAKQTKDNRFSWLSNHQNAHLFSLVSDFDKAILNFQNAILIAEKNNLADSLLAKSYNGLGICLKEKGQYKDAVKNILKAITIHERQKKIESVLACKGNLAKLYLEKGDFALARTTLNDIIKNSNNEVRHYAYHTLANFYGETGKIDSALLIDNQQIAEITFNDNKLLLSAFYNNKALCYLEKELLDSSIFYLKKSYTIDSINNNSKNMAANTIALADIYLEKGKFTEAYFYYDKSLAIYKRIGVKKGILDSYEKLSSLFKNQNKWDIAYLYKDSANVIKNELNNTAISNKIEVLKIEYETNKKDNIIGTQDNEIQSQKILFISMTLFLILGICLILFYFKIKAEKQKLHQQQLINDISFETEQTERTRIASDLHDGIGQKLSVVKMQLSLKTDEALQKAIILLDGAINDVRSASHNLFPNDLNKGLFVALEELVDQINYTSDSTKIDLTISAQLKQQSLNKQTELYLYRVIQEITNNAIKYARAENICIHLDCEKNNILLDISDNGIGFDTDQITNLKGIGLKSIHNRVEQLKGVIHIESQLNKGTQFKISAPL